MANNAYEKLGLTKEDVIEIQHFLFPIMSANESIGAMMLAVVQEYVGAKQQYAIFLIGWHIGAARTKEPFGIAHVLNADAL